MAKASPRCGRCGRPFVAYVLSFVYVGIYWNNHHHLFFVVEKVNGGVLWANIHLLFWLSLLPFVDRLGQRHAISRAIRWRSMAPCCSAAAMAYLILVIELLRAQGGENPAA